MNTLTKLQEKIFKAAFYTAPIGLFIVDKHSKIMAWNNWMVKNSKITEEKALNQTLNKLFPNEKLLRYEWALEQVLTYSNPQFISQALNKYLFPCRLENELGFEGLELMQQTVEIHPMTDADSPYALIAVEDVTMKSHQQNALLNMAKRFETESLFDELTGIYNRKFVPTWVNLEMNKAINNGKSITCSLFDLDHFKQINDTFGHKGGDEVLVSFTNIVKSSLREDDLFARLGGEEFVVFSIMKPSDNPCIFAERIRKNFMSKKTHGSVNKMVTCSVGVARWDPENSSIIEADNLIDKADKVLYEAKNSGRNRVCLYNSN